MKVLVTGVGGQLGFDVSCELAKRGHDVIGSDVSVDAPERFAELFDSSCYYPLDITDEEAVMTLFLDEKPDAVIHCAAWTAVDAAEDPANIEKVRAVNDDGTRYIATTAKIVDAKMVYISTDYVFNGTGSEPWTPDCKDYNPINNYGMSKLHGELAVFGKMEKFFIVRIAWVFGLNGNNFVKTMLRVGKTHKQLRVVNDQVGYYHATNEGCYISWYEFATEIFRQAALKWPEAGYNEVSVSPVTTEEYGLSAAARPFNSRLDKSKLDDAGFERLPVWQDALARYLDQIDWESI